MNPLDEDVTVLTTQTTTTRAPQGRFLTFGAYPRKFVQLMEADWGLPAEKVLTGTGLTRPQLDDPELMVPFEDIVTVFNNGYRLCGSGDIGLRFAAQLRPSSHGLLGAAVLTSSDLQSVIDLFYDYLGLIAPFLLLHQEERGNNRMLVLEIISDVPEMNPVVAYDVAMLSTYNVFKLILGERTRELVFHFAHAAPRHADAYGKYFDCHTQFSASCYGVSIPKALLGCRVATSDEDTHRLLVGQIDERMNQVHAQSSFVDSVRFHLKRNDGPLPRMNSVAAAFNMSARTFRNRLRRHNTTFQELLDRERHEQAMHFLRSTGKSVKEIAYMLGFQESSNFSRVFKKWTGLTPLDFRRGN
ncbi:MAG: Transcriptional regulator, AraC family [Moraxellaceae bacterium]|jgi:AraC-like DNA-binding protein|nr:Transcriptional regulator, AraC family [Moraxellaceae bacterium]